MAIPVPATAQKILSILFIDVKTRPSPLSRWERGEGRTNPRIEYGGAGKHARRSGIIGVISGIWRG